jgi:AMP-polyphosphate phosphotransferase
MFDSTRLDHSLDKAAFKALEPQLREELLNAQFELLDHGRKTVLVLINGPDGAGKGGVVNRLYEWMDAHYLETLAFEPDAAAERGRPAVAKYWDHLPARGRIGIVLGSWYHAVLHARAVGPFDESEFSAALGRINRFEAMLEAEGVLVLKIWLQIDAAESRRRFKKAKEKDGYSRPVVEEWAEIDTRPERERLVDAAMEMARVTSTGISPWSVVPAIDAQYREARVAELLLATMRRANIEASIPVGPEPAEKAAGDLHLPKPSILSSLDLGKSIAPKKYKTRLAELQQRLTRLTTSREFEKIGLVCAFEGNDAAGKGGMIGRVRQALDPRRFQVHQVGAPTEEERARPYLWRFWRRIPDRGHIAFFDRSWYGRVLVERVEGFAPEADWRRAYAEINEFELVLSEAGYLVMKFWLAISPEEQLKRFKAREEVPFKRFKITDEDWRNREKWPAYEHAVTDMVDRTSTPYAPWTLIESEDKRYGRVKVLETIVQRLETALAT